MNEESVLNQKRHSNKANEAPTGSLNIQPRTVPAPEPKTQSSKRTNISSEEIIQYQT